MKGQFARSRYKWVNCRREYSPLLVADSFSAAAAGPRIIIHLTPVVRNYSRIAELEVMHYARVQGLRLPSAKFHYLFFALPQQDSAIGPNAPQRKRDINAPVFPLRPL